MITRPSLKTIFVLTNLLFFFSCNQQQQEQEQTSSSHSVDPVAGEHHFISGYEPITNDSLVNVVIEIPAGTDAKWEVEKESGHIAWEYRDGEPRVVQYIGYPGNYGMVPRTLAGDGDTIDVLVLGAPIERGEIVETRIIGVLEMIDDDEQDDKLIAVTTDSHFNRVNNMEELDLHFRGVSTIIETWFENYKGSDFNVEIIGIRDVDRAWEILRESVEAYGN
ncbi:inorganic diphosphatase [Rhodohalobacter sp. SW132]|nr:inorganic diphosphatase [Rhodohalobacter sp. SW132]REL37920.1 inorganic diphosphatase [Rhodohalobacter sp. SW132]